jgi:folate-binding protein YgfZ
MISEGSRFLSYHPAATVRVTGDDAFTFLQGQFTNELRQVSGNAVYGLWLDQKGRVLADSHVLGISENEFLICSRHSAAEIIRRRLEAYIVADDVTLADETTATHGLVLFGARSDETIERAVGARPSGSRFICGAGVIAFAGRQAREQNFELIGSAEALRDIQQQLQASGAKPAAAAELEFARIAAGIPDVPVDAGPGDLPNEAGLDAMAISYTKGCYLGQEVMARLKNLGQVRRRLHVVRGRGSPPAARSALYQGAKKVGEIRSAAGRENEFVAFAMLSLINFGPGSGLSLEPAGEAVMAVETHG